jgi:hypothetical protein
MPAPFKEYNIDVAGDGFDPLIPYQMVPLNGSRDFTLQTGDLPAEIVLQQPNITSLSNFRVLRGSPAPFINLPGIGQFAQRVVIPPRSVVRFALFGHAVGATVMNANDLPGNGAPPLRPGFALLVSVKAKEIRRFALCHVFDRVNVDTGERLDINAAFTAANAIIEEQSNFNVVNIDGGIARSITMPATSGKTFDFVDAELNRRLIRTFDATFPGVFGQTHAVIFVFKVPLRHVFFVKKKPTDKKRSKLDPRILGFNQRAQFNGNLFNMVFIGRLSARELPLLEAVLAHEIGHSLGLAHLPEQDSPLIPKAKPGIGGRPQLELFMHNLMFPFGRFRFARINGFQIERLHVKPALTPVLTI